MWTRNGDGSYYPSYGLQVDQIEPGIYNINRSDMGIIFNPIVVNDESLVPIGTHSDRILDQIEIFWTREATFAKYKIPYKRGFLLYGEPGTGKSCIVRMVCTDVVKRGGLVLIVDRANMFEAAYSAVRVNHPSIPIVALIEDLDNKAEYDEEDITNLLDGVGRVHKVVFIATTNYVSRLSPRIKRPSRFDLWVEVPLPAEADRYTYLKHIAQDSDFDLADWASKTDKFSFAHLKELFLSVQVFGIPFAEAVERVRALGTVVTEDDDDDLDSPTDARPLSAQIASE